MSDNPEGGLTSLVLPFVKTDSFPPEFPRFVSDKEGYSPEPMLNALAAFVYRVAGSINPDMIQDVTVKMLPHKADFLELDDGPSACRARLFRKQRRGLKQICAVCEVAKPSTKHEI